MHGCYGGAVVRTFLARRLVRKAAGVKGGVILFRGGGTAARRYLEADRSQADDYYLQGGTALASFTITDASGAAVAEAGLDPVPPEYSIGRLTCRYCLPAWCCDGWLAGCP
jgi:hypothetical protein